MSIQLHMKNSFMFYNYVESKKLLYNNVYL